jgi:hypothetical protein
VALSYSIDADQRLVVITGDYADVAEWRDLIGRLLVDPALRPGLCYLRDLREAGRTVDASTVVAIVEVVRRFWPMAPPARAAIVTPRLFDDAAMVAQAALADAQHLPMQVFNSYEAAIEWLAAADPLRT